MGWGGVGWGRDGVVIKERTGREGGDIEWRREEGDMGRCDSLLCLCWRVGEDGVDCGGGVVSDGMGWIDECGKGGVECSLWLVGGGRGG